MSTPRATRTPQGRWVAGVCTGLSQHLGWPVSVVRFSFTVLALVNGLGVALYLAYWVVLPRGAGPRRQYRELLSPVAFGAAVATALLVAVIGGWDFVGSYVGPVLIVVLGLAILWQQVGPGALSAPSQGEGEGRRWVRPVLGVALVAAGVVALLVFEVGLLQAINAIGVLLLILGGAVVLALPWLVRLYRDREAERSARLRERERTEIAAQVHDSVLQTLTLIQRNAADSDQVAVLARTEERRLRAWLYEPVGPEHETFAAAVQHAAAAVEADHGAMIDVVHVGDAPLAGSSEALLAAATEAMVNAARHAGPHAAVSVYAEIEDSHAEVFVRDRGPGFDPAMIGQDRHGVRHSIVGRMERVGGTAVIRRADPGTEVQLAVDLEGE